MANGRRKPEQQKMWINQHQLPKGQGHPFYSRLNDFLARMASTPGLKNSAPQALPAREGTPYRREFISGCCSSATWRGFVSDRAIAWNCQDRLSLRAFLGIPLHESTPAHSSLSIWRQRGCPWRPIGLLSSASWPSSTGAGIDLRLCCRCRLIHHRCHASLKRLARKDSGASYLDYVKELMREAREEPADTAAVVRFDRKHKSKKLSDRHWQSTTSPDSRIAKMKDGTTHLA